MVKLYGALVAMVLALVAPVVATVPAHAADGQVPVSSGSCSPGWYVNDDGDENTRKPEQTEDGLKFAGNQLAHHQPAQAITLNNLHPGTFEATPAPSLSSFFSVEVRDAGTGGYATLRYDTADGKWILGGTSNKQANPEGFVGASTKWGELTQQTQVISFGVGYVRTPGDGAETVVKAVTFAGKTYDLTCKKPAFVPSVLDVKAKCRWSKTDKRQVWTVTNAQGGRDRQLWAWLYSRNPHPGTAQNSAGFLHLPDGKGSYTVKAGKTLQIVTGWGGGLAVHYYDGAGQLRKAWVTSDHRVTCH